MMGDDDLTGTLIEGSIPVTYCIVGGSGRAGQGAVDRLAALGRADIHQHLEGAGDQSYQHRRLPGRVITAEPVIDQAAAPCAHERSGLMTEKGYPGQGR